MNRRGFLGLLGQLVAVGAAIGIAPEIIAPLKENLGRDPGHSSPIETCPICKDYGKPAFALAS